MQYTSPLYLFLFLFPIPIAIYPVSDDFPSGM